nr:hypothetical protein [Tanacetum cinerariifolium]
ALRDGEACQRCTCKRCGSGLSKGLCLICGNNQNSLNDSPNIFANSSHNPPHIDERCFECCDTSNAQYGHNCTPQVPLIYPKPGYSQDLNSSQNFHDFQQQYICCDQCGGPHETFQCQPTNEDYYDEQNSCYNSNSFGSDQCQPPQYTVNHPIFNAHNDFLNSQNELSIAQNKIMEQMTQLTSMCELVCQNFQKKQEEKQIEEVQAASARYWKSLACCDDDDDYDSAITAVLSTEETKNSLSMGDEHLDTIPETESNEVINSSIEDLVPIPSESEA